MKKIARIKNVKTYILYLIFPNFEKLW
jgi:hypothetical protein